MGDLPTPGQPVSFPDNFPDEAFWSTADSSLDAGGGDTALLVTARRGRLRPRRAAGHGRPGRASAGSGSGPPAWSTAPSTRSPTRTASTPSIAEAGAVKGVNVTEDIGVLTPDGVFDQTLGSRPAPFLKWTGTGAPSATWATPPWTTRSPAAPTTPTSSASRVRPGPSPAPRAVRGREPRRLAHRHRRLHPDHADSRSGQERHPDGRPGRPRPLRQFRRGHTMDLSRSPSPARTSSSTAPVSPTPTCARTGEPGRYYARVFADGAPPPTCRSPTPPTAPTPSTTSPCRCSTTSCPHIINSAQFDNDTGNLTVDAQSGDGSSDPEARGLPDRHPGTAGLRGPRLFTVTGLAIPPATSRSPPPRAAPTTTTW